MDRRSSPRRSTPTLPAWIADEVDFHRAYAGADARISVALELARANVDYATGGPFGAAIFNAGGALVAVGVNRVQRLRSSLAHAELIALAGAQQKLGRARLNENGGHYTLATAGQPCCQCYGAIMWAGIDELLIAGRGEDIESLAGFDEGPLPEDWTGELERRDIRVVRDLHRGAAREVLASYVARGGARY